MIINDDSYVHYKNANEDMVPALWSCSQLSSIWNHGTCGQFRSRMVFQSFKDLTKFIIEKGLNLEEFSTTVWMVWSRINLLRTRSKPFLIQ